METDRITQTEFETLKKELSILLGTLAILVPLQEKYPDLRGALTEEQYAEVEGLSTEVNKLFARVHRDGN